MSRQLQTLLKRLQTLFTAVYEKKHPATPAPPGPTPPPPPGPTPPPPPAPAIAPDQMNNVPLTLTSADSGVRPFMVGQAFRQGEVPSGSGVIVTGGDVNAQVTPKNTWPDGSLKFAVIAGTATLSSTPTQFTLSVGSYATGTAVSTATLKAAIGTVTITAGAFGSASFSGTDFDSPWMTWVSGHRMSCWIFRKPIGSDPHLVAWLRVCMWANGDISVFEKVTNARLNVANPTNKSATYTFALNGTQRFSGAIDLTHHSWTRLLNGTNLLHWHGTARDVWPTHDREYLASTLLVPSVDPELDYDDWPGMTMSTYSPLALGMFRSNMSDPGGDPSLGIVPRWDAAVLCSRGPTAFKSMFRQAMSWGRFPIHWHDEAAALVDTPMAFSAYPTLGASDSGVSSLKDSAPAEIYTPTPTGTVPPQYAQSHAPRLPDIAYLLTGEPFFIEEVMHAAITNHLMLAAFRANQQGLVPYNNVQTRARAWNFRTMFTAAGLCPDAHPLKAEFAAVVDNNINYYHARRNNAFGIIPQNGTNTNQGWQHDFHVGAVGLGLAHQLGTTSAIRTKLSEFFHWTAKGTVGRLGGLSNTEWGYRDAAVSPQGNSGIAGVISPTGSDDSKYDHETGLAVGGGPAQVWANWGEMFSFWMRYLPQQPPYSLPDPGPQVNRGDYGYLDGGIIGDSRGLWGNLQIGLSAALTFGVEGASEGHARMVAASNWPSMIAHARENLSPEYMLVANVGPAYYVPARGIAAVVNENTIDAIDPDNNTGNHWWNGFYNAPSASGVFTDWNGGAFGNGYSLHGISMGHGGGHGSNVLQMVVGFDNTTLTWMQRGNPINRPATIEEWTGLSGNSQSATYNSGTDLRDSQYYEYTYNGSKIGLAPHEYAELSYLSEAHYGGPVGSLVIPSYWRTQQPEYPTSQAFRQMSLATGIISRPSSSPAIFGGGDGSMTSVDDPKQQRLWWFYDNNSTAQYFDKTSPTKARQSATWTFEAGSVGALGVYNHSYELAPEANNYGVIIAGTGGQNGYVSVQVFQLTDTGPILTGVRPPNSPAGQMNFGGKAAAVAWDPHLRRFTVYEGRGLNVVHVLTPSSLDFRTCTWTWHREQISGHAMTDQFSSISDLDLKSSDQFSPRRHWRYSKGRRVHVWVQGRGVTGTQRRTGLTVNSAVIHMKMPGTKL